MGVSSDVRKLIGVCVCPSSSGSVVLPYSLILRDSSPSLCKDVSGACGETSRECVGQAETFDVFFRFDCTCSVGLLKGIDSDMRNLG